MQTLYVDYSFARPPIASIRRAGYKGIIRYLAPMPNSKVIAKAEVDAAMAAGLDVVLNWEWYASRIREGAAAGAVDGAEANRQADALGYPRWAAIYYSCDYDAPPRDLPAIAAYLRAAHTYGRPAGVYGGAFVVESLLKVGAARYGWQAGGPSAWLGNTVNGTSYVSTISHLYQRARPTLPNPGGAIDENVLLQTDVGSWLTARKPGDVTVTDGPPLVPVNAPAVAVVPVPGQEGAYWQACADGGVFTFGGAPFYGSAAAVDLNAPVVDMAATPSGKGYWLVGADGGVFTFGDAGMFGSLGSTTLNSPVTRIAPTPTGKGYYMFSAGDGGVFAFGDAVYQGRVNKR